MLPEIRSILMRANRHFGAALVETNLLSMEQLETANEKLIESLSNESELPSGLLSILAYDMKVLSEADVLRHCYNEHRVGMISLEQYEQNEELLRPLDLDICRATWTIPFDKEEDFTLLASAYYPSSAVRKHWEAQFPGHLLWYGTTIEEIDRVIERERAIRAAIPNT